MGYIEGTQEDETRLHREFEEERIRKRNEWFEPSPQLKKRIQDLLKENIKEKEEGIPDFQDDLDNENVIHDSISLFYDWETFEWSTEKTVKVENGFFPDSEIDKPKGEYSGKLKNRKADGYGKLVVSEWEKDEGEDINFTYEGRFSEGKFTEGKKVYTAFKDTFYSGNWKDGKPHGQGIMDYTAMGGNLTDGEWKRGKIWEGKVQNSDGKVISVFWQGVEKDPMVMGYSNEDDEKTFERNILTDLFWILLVSTPVLIFLFW